MIWRFRRQGQTGVIADKVRLLTNHEIDGYHHPNETRWDSGPGPGQLVFRNSAGVVSTAFTTFGAGAGAMSYSGAFAFDASITHVLEEVAPGWRFDSSYICWLPFRP
jgi:hypothetical protein